MTEGPPAACLHVGSLSQAQTALTRTRQESSPLAVPDVRVPRLPPESGCPCTLVTSTHIGIDQISPAWGWKSWVMMAQPWTDPLGTPGLESPQNATASVTGGEVATQGQHGGR